MKDVAGFTHLKHRATNNDKAEEHSTNLNYLMINTCIGDLKVNHVILCCPRHLGYSILKFSLEVGQASQSVRVRR
jgi:hypothetical protein